MALPSAGNGGVPVGPVASTQLLFTSLAAYFDFSAQPRPLEHCYPEGERNVYSHFLKTVLENLKIFTDLLSKFPFLQYKKQRKIQALQFLLKSSAN